MFFFSSTHCKFSNNNNKCYRQIKKLSKKSSNVIKKFLTIKGMYSMKLIRRTWKWLFWYVRASRVHKLINIDNLILIKITHKFKSIKHFFLQYNIIQMYKNNWNTCTLLSVDCRSKREWFWLPSWEELLFFIIHPFRKMSGNATVRACVQSDATV